MSSSPVDPPKVVPFRSRAQVARRLRIGSFRSDPEDLELKMGLSPRLRVHGSIGVRELMTALSLAGLRWKHDERTGEVVLFPAANTQPEGVR